MPRTAGVTGLILAGGRGSRMGGVDKGLQVLEGKPLVEHALQRLAPQVQTLMINANRSLDVYAGFGLPVWPDADTAFAGPLAGFLAGLRHCDSDWLVTVPCDTPRFPLDLVKRLTGLRAGARAAVVVSEEGGRAQRQPVFCLLHHSVQDDLADYLAGGDRKIDRWLDRIGCTDVHFDDADAFFNLNTLDELQRLASGAPP